MPNKTKKFTFINDFHNTETTAIAKVSSNGKGYKLTHAQLKRIKKDLCGIKDCTCGSIRGQHDFGYEIHQEFIYLYEK